jgi:retron-type reverse transcriptase
MGTKHRNLMPLIVAPDNMRRAYRQTAKGKRRTPGYLEFKEHAEANLARLADDMAAGRYQRGDYREFTIREPKPRRIMALPFRDRLAQHALCNVIEPIFEQGFAHQSYACRPGRGTHAGAVRTQALMRHLGRAGPVHVLKVDFAGYFYSIDRARLHAMLRKKVACRATLRLMEEITPPEGRGIPIGSLTSQLYANVYATAFDRWLIAEGWRDFVRYMDDTVVFGHSAAELRALKERIVAFVGEALGLRLSKWSVQPVTRGVNFLGYRIWPTHKLLRRQSVTGAKRAIRALRARGDDEALARFVASWRGHAQWADAHHLLTALEIER